MTTREYILDEARKCVMRDRNLDYDEPEKNFERIADFWNTYLGDKLAMPITPHDTAIMAIMIKISRIMQSPGKADHWTDIAGYAACGAEAAGIKEPDSDYVPYFSTGGVSAMGFGTWSPVRQWELVQCKCDQECACRTREDRAGLGDEEYERTELNESYKKELKKLYPQYDWKEWFEDMGAVDDE